MLSRRNDLEQVLGCQTGDYKFVQKFTDKTDLDIRLSTANQWPVL